MSNAGPEGRKRDNLRRIEREIRDWTAGPPARSPRMARARVLARIPERRTPERRTWSGWIFAAAAAAAVALLALGLFLHGPEAPSDSTVIAAVEPSPGLLVYELESGTKLYLALAVTQPIVTTTMEGIR